MWMEVNATDGAQHIHVVCGGFYAAPGGDKDTWTQVLDEFEQMWVPYPNAAIYALCDGNAHLQSVVSHVEGCVCGHCRQSAHDTAVEAMVHARGMYVLNTGDPTHDSGTTIDLILCHKAVGKATIFPQCIGGSDHRCVAVLASAKVELEYSTSLGRVSRAHPEQWQGVLSQANATLEEFVQALSDASDVIAVQGDMPRHKVRALLETAASARDAPFCVLGQAGELVKATVASSSTQSSPAGGPLTKQEAVKALNRRKLANMQQFVQLHRNDQAQAQTFRSSFLKRQKQFEIALVDAASHHVLPLHDATVEVPKDVCRRGNNTLPQDEMMKAALATAVAAIRHNNAPPQGLPRFLVCPM